MATARTVDDSDNISDNSDSTMHATAVAAATGFTDDDADDNGGDGGKAVRLRSSTSAATDKYRHTSL